MRLQLKDILNPCGLYTKYVVVPKAPQPHVQTQVFWHYTVDNGYIVIRRPPFSKAINPGIQSGNHTFSAGGNVSYGYYTVLRRVSQYNITGEYKETLSDPLTTYFNETWTK